MKLILFALLWAGVAVAKIEEWNWLDQVSPNRKVQDSAFRNGREYQYFYNGQLCTGVPGSSKQHSANRIQALATVSFKNQNQVTLRLEKIRVGKMNRDIPNPRKIMPFDAYEQVQIDQQLKHKLERPLKFTYVGGMVHDVAFDSQDDPWSANIKRGVLNLLQVNLQQQRRVDTAEEARLTNVLRHNRGNGGNNQVPDFYRVMEQTVEGECETAYTIQQQPCDNNPHCNDQVLNVTKSINFENCNNRPQIKYNFRFGDSCPTCQPKYNEQEKFLKSSTVAQYNITGNKQAFLIEHARIDSEYTFTPFNEEANVIVTYVNQTLILVKSGPAQNNAEPQNPVQSNSNMVYTLDWDIAYEKFHMNGNDQAHRQLHQSQQGLNKVQQSKQLVQKLSSQMKEQLDDNTPTQFIRLVEMMRMCQEQELEEISNEQGTPEEQQKVKSIIPQALGACGTKQCTKLLAQKIRQGQISPLKGALAIKGLLHIRVASKEIIQEVMQLAETQKAQQNPVLKQSAWLTVGSLINALCAENEDQLALESKQGGEKLCPNNQKQEYIKELFNKLRQAQNWQDKILMLKTIGNAGLDQSVFELENIIRQKEGNNQPSHQRFEAILALHQLTDSIPQKIQRILMPVAMNRQDNPTIRSASVYMLLQTNPKREILEQLAHDLNDEPSRQYAAFSYSALQSYANSTNPCEQELAANAKLALRHAKKINTGLGYSKMGHVTLQSQNQQVGLDVDMDVLFSNTSPIPRHASIALHGNALGFWQKYLATLTMFNEGLEPLMRQFFDNDDGFNGNPFNQAWNRHPRSTRNDKNQYEQELNDIFSKHLKIRARQYNNDQNDQTNEPKAYLAATFKGQSLGFLPLTQQTIQELVQDSTSGLGKIEQQLRQGLQVDYATVGEAHDMLCKIPTTLGMPLSLTIKTPLAWSLKGKLQANKQSSNNFHIQAQLKPSAVAQLLVKMQAWSPIVVSGVIVKAKAKLFAPVDANLEVNLANKPVSIKANIKPPTKKRDLLILESKPISYTQEWQKYVRNPTDGQDDKTIMGEEQNRVQTFKQCAGQQTLGVEICARGQVHRTRGQTVPGTPFAPLSGPNKIAITCQPGQNAPQEIQVKITGQSQQVNGNQMKKPQFSQFNQQQNDQDDNNDDYDESSSSSSEISDEQQNDNQQTSGSQEQQGQPRRHHNQQNQNQQQQQQQQRGNNRRRNQQGQQQNQRNGQNNFQQILQQYRDYSPKKGQQTKIRVELQAGQNRKLNAEFNHVYDSKNRYNQVNMKLQRQRPDQWEACLDAEMMFPQTPQSANDVKDKKVAANGQLTWGQTCNSQNYIQLTARAERSSQQMQWERHQNQYNQCNNNANNGNGNNQCQCQQNNPHQCHCSNNGKRCKNNKQCQNEQDSCSPLAQQDLVEKIGQMMKYNIKVNYQNVPSSVQKTANAAYRAIKHAYFQQTDVNQFTPNQQNQIRAEIVLDAQSKQRVNVTIKTPKETAKIQDLPLQQPIAAVSQKQSFSQQLREYMNDEENQAECQITSKNGHQGRAQVETFDGSKFTAPFTNCWVVLAKDCGSQQPNFAVMARKSQSNNGNGNGNGNSNGNGNQNSKDVKIVTKHNRIQLNTQNPESIQVKVNGKQIDMDNQDEIMENGKVVARINQDGSTVHVQLPKAGVEVQFDGYAINVQLSDYYRGQQCGLCGHFDGEQQDEFRNPDFTTEQDLRQFYMNYLINDGQCQAPQQLEQVCDSQECDQDDQSSSSSSSSSSQETQEDSGSNEDSETPEYKTKVIQVDNQLCFSTVPVPQCDEEDSYPVGSKQQKKVAYACFDQDSQSAEEMERQARKGKNPSQPLQNRTPTFTRTENIPEKCQKYNSNNGNNFNNRNNNRKGNNNSNANNSNGDDNNSNNSDDNSGNDHDNNDN